MKFRDLVNKENWNIGIVDNITPDKFVAKRKLPEVKWLRHPYKDRAFADPHILSCTEKELRILCEELLFGNKGRISLLVIDRNNYELKNRKVILDRGSHLSYPAILEVEGKIYVYPENSEEGKIRFYLLDPVNCELKEDGVIVEGDCTDFTICNRKEYDYWFALSTKLHPDSEENAYLFKSRNKLGPYSLVDREPVVSDRACSRPGGNFFHVNDKIYRPAQDCTGHYGRGLKILEVESFDPYRERELFSLYPKSFKYHLGLHTLNFKDGVAVIDGYGYLHPILGRVLSPVNNLRTKLKN